MIENVIQGGEPVGHRGTVMAPIFQGRDRGMHARQANAPSPIDLYTQIEPGLWMGACPPLESPEFADAILNVFGLHNYARRCQVYREARLVDSTVSDPKLVESLAFWVDEQRKRDLTVLIHCEEGRNRSGLIAGLYLIRYRGMQPQEAIDLIREMRGPSALWNGSFVRYLSSGASESGIGSSA